MSLENTPDHQKNRPENIERDTTFWRSFNELENSESFKENLNKEFLSSPLRAETANEGTENDGVARRDFLKLMGASLALSSAAGCIRRPVQKIVPYNKQPEEVTVGVSNYYTSSYFDGQEGLGLLIKSREGRPIHIEGNPDFPTNKGSASVRAQASLLSLYNPERLTKPCRNLLNEKRTNKESVGISWDELDAKALEALQKGSVALLTGSIASPSTKAVVGDFCSAFKATHYQWEALTLEDVMHGQKASYGEAVVPEYRYDQAKTIVSIDADFLGAWGPAMAATRLFADGRRNPSEMSRLYSFDSTYSLTGSNADIRFKIKPSQQLRVALALAHELQKQTGASASLPTYSLAELSSDLGVSAERLNKVATELYKNRGSSIVVAGGLQTFTDEAQSLQIVVNYINSILGNEGKTVRAHTGTNHLQASYSEMISLISKMQSGEVKTLIIHRANPLYSLPQSFGFHEALNKVETVIYIGDTMNETARLSHFVVTENHSLETWGDTEFSHGLYGIHQPLIRSMYDTRSFQLSLMTWGFMGKVGPERLQKFETYYDYLRAFWKTELVAEINGSKLSDSDFEKFWNELLQKGFKQSTKNTTSKTRTFKNDALSTIKTSAKKSGFELALYSKSHIADGTLGNVAWLQELPDPVTKIVWDNYAMVSMKTAETNKLREGDVVEVKVGTTSLNLPTHIQPGLHDDVVAVAVGYGRKHAGKVGDGIGVNAFEFLTLSGNSAIAAGMTVELKKTGEKIQLATTQEHHSMEGRQIIVQATNLDYEKKKDANIHRHHTWSIWSGHQYNGHKWGMALDLNSCTGCSACMTACQSENNIHTVGKKYILQGREMHWIRIDRYYVGDADNAQAVFQPVMCQHCDNAPCETVCPVAATVHNSEGLNDMIYNRCVGTRYCSNNCPYKVRRFNWFNYAKLIEKPMHMALNSEVGVRTRGVMEKCTFCVQRIKEAKNKAKVEERELKDGDVKTACEVVCPAQVITFGDLNDENSRVAQIFKAEERSYALLEEWYAKPSVRYMSKIRNNDEVTPEKGAEHA